MTTSTLELILEMDPENFETVQDSFIGAFAAVLRIDISDIWIADIQRGCTILIIVAPDHVAAEFIAEFNSGNRPPMMAELKSAYKIKQAHKAGTIEAPYVIAARQMRRSHSSTAAEGSSRSLTWLHISDLHMLAKGGGAAFEQQVVVSKLLQQLPSLLKAHNIEPDVVFFTGDIAQSGLPSEYAEAKRFLKQLMARLPKQPRVFAIPGNHDANWNLIDLDAELKLRQLLQSKSAVSGHLLDPKHELAREQGFLRLKYYYQFADECAEFGQPERNFLYFYTTKFVHDGLRVGVAGLNSAWRCTKKDAAPTGTLTNDLDLGHLIVGEPQLKNALDDLKDCDLRVALIHHPPMDSWFAEFDKQVQEIYFSDFDYVLRGHEHRVATSVWSKLEPKLETILFSAGALYQAAPWNKLFTALVVKISSKRQTQTLYKWKYDDPGETWNAIVEPGARKPGMQTSLTARLRDRVASTGTS